MRSSEVIAADTLAMEREKRGEVVTICQECSHFLSTSYAPGYILLGGPRCAMVRVEFVHRGMVAFKPCEEVNVDGKCPMFEPKPAPPLKRSLWQRLFR